MKTFEELDLIAPVQRALVDERYETPTPIQAQTVPPALLGRDILGCAQTGTGKTAAFALPILNRLGQHNRKAQPNCPLALVLAPTRELAIQIGQSFATYGKRLHLRQALVYGGVSQGQQVRSLNRGAHILVATPGRLLDLIGQGHIELNQLQVFVLDEVDRMLDMGFLPDLKRIISQLPKKRQSLFFSATLPPKITALANSLLTSPVSVNVAPESPTINTIEQRVLLVERHGKQALLRKVLTADNVDRALVFTRTKRGANVLADKLLRSGIKATAIHGNKSQNARQKALAAFQGNQVQVLVATDVAARGIDIDGITHVVNFDMPHEPESYVHRIGRTGRAGEKGIAVSFCSANERSELRAIEELIGKKLPLSGQQSHPEKQRPPLHARRHPSVPKKRSAANGSGPKRYSTATLTEAARDEGPPNQKRRRRRKHPKRSATQPR